MRFESVTVPRKFSSSMALKGYRLDLDSIRRGQAPDVGEAGYCEVLLENTLVNLLPNVARHIADFSHRRYEHELRNNDCAAFAHAVLYDDLPNGRCPQGIKVSGDTPRDLGYTNPVYKPGKTLLTVNDGLFDGDIKPWHDYHFMVAASPDVHTGLYVSKLGFSGPTVLHTFEQSAKMYPVQSVMQVADIKLGG